MDLVPLKIDIGLKLEGGRQVHAHPDFNKIPAHLRGGMDWSYFLTGINGGPFYDHCCGHHEVDDEDPTDPFCNTKVGCWHAMILVPKDFADEALKLFGPNGTLVKDQVEEVDAEDFEEFYNKRHATRIPEQEIDEKRLASIKAKQDVGASLTKDDEDALDPEKPTPGIKKNPLKRWKDRQKKQGITIQSRVEGKLKRLKRGAQA